MTHTLRTVDLGFLDEAPLRFEYEADVAAPPADVFAAIVSDPATWDWFPGLDEGGYEGDGPHGVGSRRWVRMGDSTYRETILVSDPPTRWAYSVDESSDAAFEALLEDWTVAPGAGGSVVHWTFAFSPLPELAAILADASEIIGRAFFDAMSGLNDRLTSSRRRSRRH